MSYAVRTDANYLGVLYQIGNTKTPFTSMIGGLSLARGSLSVSTGFQFPLSQYYSLASASQDVTNETATQTKGTATTITRSQAYNVCQIMKKNVGVSFAKQSAFGEISGIAIAGQQQPVANEFAFQKEAQLKQLAVDIEYSFINGSYVASNVAGTSMATRGILEAIITNAVAAGGAELDTSLMDDLEDLLYANSEMIQPVIYASGKQYKKIRDIYGFPPQDRNIGGVNINVLVLSLCGTVAVVPCPAMPADSLVIADISKIVPVFCPIGPDLPGAGEVIVFIEEAQVAAQKSGFWYTQIGLGYGNEKFHGKITGLSTS